MASLLYHLGIFRKVFVPSLTNTGLELQKKRLWEWGLVFPDVLEQNTKKLEVPLMQ